MTTQQPLAFEALLKSIETAQNHPNDTAWDIYRYLNAHISDKTIASQEARTLLAAYMRLPLGRPSLLHSCFLALAVKMSQAFEDFRFSNFLEMWGIDRNLREEDYKEQTAKNGFKIPSLKERVDRALHLYILRNPQAINDLSNRITLPSLLVGYVEYIAVERDFFHIYDSFSRHFVAIAPNPRPQQGDYVMFVPEFPKEGKFKKASMVKVCERQEGMKSFGLRKAKVTFSDREQGYCAWELLDNETPIAELGIEEPTYKSGYLSLHTCQNLHQDLPKEGDMISIVTFLKRGKDQVKRPYVVFFTADSLA